MGLIEGFKPIYFTGASARTFASGKLHASSVVVANTDTNPDTVTFTDNDDTTIMVVNCVASGTVVVDGAGADLLFNNGLKMTASAATIHVTVFGR